MNIVKIILTCPHCGNSLWVERPDEDHMFECLACEALACPENMDRKTKEETFDR